MSQQLGNEVEGKARQTSQLHPGQLFLFKEKKKSCYTCDITGKLFYNLVSLRLQTEYTHTWELWIRARQKIKLKTWLVNMKTMLLQTWPMHINFKFGFLPTLTSSSKFCWSKIAPSEVIQRIVASGSFLTCTKVKKRWQNKHTQYSNKQQLRIGLCHILLTNTVCSW
jgi:hypothetical protein